MADLVQVAVQSAQTGKFTGFKTFKVQGCRVKGLGVRVLGLKVYDLLTPPAHRPGPGEKKMAGLAQSVDACSKATTASVG